MASMTSSVSGSTTTYVITDVAGNTVTVTALPPGQVVGIATSGSGVLNDALSMLAQLLLQLAANGTSPRPQVLPNTTASLYS